jgi:ABC-2 type transport system ATP-binding protein
MSIVQTHLLSKTFRSGFLKRTRVEALRNVTLAVEKGEIFGLLGPNGAGKTTFVKILLSIIYPTSGEAEVLDRNLGSLLVRQKSGYLPENHRYPSFLSGRQTLHFFGGLHGLRGRALQNRAQSLLELVGLRNWANVKIKRYSKGMLQRLGMAQALLNDPELLFLDEPTDGVDPVGRKEIRDLLKELKARGTTIFLNSHLLSEVEAISDRVAILHKGEVLKVGTVAEMTAHHMEYEIRTDKPLPERATQAISGIVREARPEGNVLHVTVNEKNDLNKILDIVRGEGIFVESMTPKRSSLEDYFIEVIRSEEAI